MYKTTRCGDFVVGGAKSLPAIEVAIIEFSARLFLPPTEMIARFLFEGLAMRICKTEGCDHKVIAKGLCSRHYDQERVITPEYRAWQAMITRCRNANQPGWENYGGRGIRVCDEWQQSFASFLAYIGPKPSPNHSIERDDTDGNYEPGNVRWATRDEQNRNKRSNVNIEINGVTRCVKDWARLVNRDYRLIQARRARGWSDFSAIFTPSLPEPIGKRLKGSRLV